MHMKVTLFLGILLAILFMVMSGVYIEKISEIRNVYNEQLFSPETDNQQLVTQMAGELTNHIGIMSLLFFVFCAGTAIFSFIRFRRMIFILAGAVCSIGMLCWTIIMMNNPLGVSFDEVGPVWIIMTLVQMVVFIAALRETVQSLPFIPGQLSVR